MQRSGIDRPLLCPVLNPLLRRRLPQEGLEVEVAMRKADLPERSQVHLQRGKARLAIQVRYHSQHFCRRNVANLFCLDDEKDDDDW